MDSDSKPHVCCNECMIPIRIELNEQEWAIFSAEIASPRKPSAALRALFKDDQAID